MLAFTIMTNFAYYFIKVTLIANPLKIACLLYILLT